MGNIARVLACNPAPELSKEQALSKLLSKAQQNDRWTEQSARAINKVASRFCPSCQDAEKGKEEYNPLGEL